MNIEKIFEEMRKGKRVYRKDFPDFVYHLSGEDIFVREPGKLGRKLEKIDCYHLIADDWAVAVKVETKCSKCGETFTFYSKQKPICPYCQTNNELS